MPSDPLPSVTSAIPQDLRLFIDRVREQFNGSSTDPIVRQSQLTSTVDDAVSGIGDGDEDGIPIFTPPSPSGLSAVGGFDFITLIWTTPEYYGHGLNEIYRSADNVFANAQLIATLDGRVSVWSDYVGTNATFFYWVRFRNLNEVYGPYAGPVSATTAYDVNELLDVLTDQISQSQLAEDLYNLTEGVRDKYMVQIDANGVAAGFGLASFTSDSGDTTSQFGVLADRFFMLPPVTYNQATQPSSANDGELWRNSDGDYFIYNSGTWSAFDGIPFIVQTTPTNIGDVEVPAGVYIKDAFVRNASITNAKMAEASIDFANIVDASITTGKIANLDAAKIQTGEIKSYQFDNSTLPGFFLRLGQVESVDEDGNVSYVAEDPQLIIRSANSSTPALQLLDGQVSINAAEIVSTLQSQGFGGAVAGFQFDIDNGTFQVTDSSGATILSAGAGLNGDLVEQSISQRLQELQDAADDAQGAADDAQQAADDAQGTADTADQNAGTAQAAAEDAQEELDNIFEFNEGLNDGAGGYQFTAGSYDTFFSQQNQLKAYAFLDKINASNFETYIESAAIGQSAIGLAAIGTAQIEDAAIANAKIGLLAVKEGNIDSLAVSTLKIAGNAVTVPVGDTQYFSTNVFISDVYTQVGNTTTLGEWQYSGGPENDRYGPEAVLVTARVGVGGVGSGFTGSAPATVALRVRMEVKNIANAWIDIGSAAGISYAAQSFFRDYGGQAITTCILEIPWWGVDARFKLNAANIPASGDGEPTRKVDSYSISILAAKR